MILSHEVQKAIVQHWCRSSA